MAPVVTEAQPTPTTPPFTSGSPSREVPCRLSRSGNVLIKRIEDLLLAFILSLMVSPLMLIIALAIKLESRGPILFAQPRLGLNGSTIHVLKFRTMYAHREDRQASTQTSRGDPRVTRVGAFLRAHSFDELPQLFNVLCGSMSVVGPRPHAPATTAAGYELELVVPNYIVRQQVRPGMTGWAQVCGWRGNLDSIEKAARRVEHDLYYINNWSLRLDIWIILRTIRIVVHDGEAF
jgi:exopolysaccharide biosynthesis polyprenyl glycosylphosphotransferase